MGALNPTHSLTQLIYSRDRLCLLYTLCSIVQYMYITHGHLPTLAHLLGTYYLTI